MLNRYKYILKNVAILLVVSFIMCVVALNYVVDNNIMHYGEVIQGSVTIFGFYLSRTGWIIFLSIITSIVSTIVSLLFVSLIYILIKYIFRLFKMLKNKLKHI